jgi:two-component system, NarL family, nitrate/nitrite response regulator NarL
LHKIAIHRIRIVIADDHAIFRDGLRRLLASESDFDVIAEASDGKEAVALTRQLKPEILLLDLAMPRVPGMEVLRELSKDEMPVSTVLLTAAIQPIEVTYALQLGARGIVLKASPPELLLSCIRAVCGGELWLSPEILTACARFIQQPGGTPGLTSRETEIISAIRAGHSNKEIGAKLSISEETVKRHLSNIFAKLGVSSRLELAMLASGREFGDK